MKHARIIFGALLFILFAAFWVGPANNWNVSAQGDTCNALVQAAMNTASQVCNGTGRDQACYGNVLLDAELLSNFETVSFEAPGDAVDVVGIRSLQLSPLNIDEGIWGIARMQLRANLPSARPEDVTVLMFGDVALRNAIDPFETIDVRSSIGSNVNVRIGPSESFAVIGTIAPNVDVRAVARNEDTSWIRVELPELDTTGWAFAGVLGTDSSFDVLKVESAYAPHFSPMQAFYFQSGKDETVACTEVPTSGFLIQTPEGAGEVNLMINEVNIKIGSTVFFEAQPGGDMVVSTIEGKAILEYDGVRQVAFAGTQVRVPLNADGSAAGAPLPAEPFNKDKLMKMPLVALDLQVEVGDAMTPEDIEIAIQIENNGNGNGANLTDCPEGPGNSCGAPGQEDKCEDSPGRSCHAPGQNKDDKETGQDKDKDKDKDK